MASTSLLHRASSALKSNNKVLLRQTYNDLSAKIRLGRHTEISVPRRPTRIYHKIRDHEGGQEQTICRSKVILFNYI